MYIDGGKIDARVESIEPGGAVLRVTRTGAKGGKLATEKGLNFPDTRWHSAHSPKRIGARCDFVVPNADIVGYSFVQTADDVLELQREVARAWPSR